MKIQPKDYEILKHIFFPSVCNSSSEIKNNNQFVLICGGSDCAKDLDLNDVAGVIDIGKTPALPGFKSMRFHFIKNPDGSIRWMQPEDCREPLFLNLYNGSGWRGKLFRNVFKTGFSLGLKHWVVSGTFRVLYKEPLLFDGLLSEKSVTDFSIFTGTQGENRKAVFALQMQHGKNWFYKLPLTQKAAKLVRREKAVLTDLICNKFEITEVPKVDDFGQGVLISDVRPPESVNSDRLQAIHLQAIMEFSIGSKNAWPLRALPSWSEIGEDLWALNRLPIENGLPEDKVKKLYGYLAKIQAKFSPKDVLPTAISHGDFTPWNMFLSSKKIYLYDWELSARQPLLFDAFHFIFQAGILVERAPFAKLKQRVEELKNEPLIKEILGTDHSKFDELYRFYLLKNVSYYLVRYVRQPSLHAQAHWLVDTWLEAVEDNLGIQKKTAEVMPANTLRHAEIPRLSTS